MSTSKKRVTFKIDALVEERRVISPIVTEGVMHGILAEFVEQDIGDAANGVIAVGPTGLTVIPAAPEIVVTPSFEDSPRVGAKTLAVLGAEETEWEDDGMLSDDTFGDEATGLIESGGIQGGKDIRDGNGGGVGGAQVDGAASDTAATEERPSSCGCFSALGNMFRSLGDCFASMTKPSHRGNHGPYPVRHAPILRPCLHPPPKPSSRSRPPGKIPALQGYDSLSSGENTPQRSRAASALEAVLNQSDNNAQDDGTSSLGQNGTQRQPATGTASHGRLGRFIDRFSSLGIDVWRSGRFTAGANYAKLGQPIPPELHN